MMHVQVPFGLQAGFRVDADDVGPAGLVSAGEQWAPPQFDISLHHHEVWEIYLQVDGTTTWSCDDHLYDLGPAQLLAVPPRLPHRLVPRPATTHHFYFAAIDLEAAGRDTSALDLTWAAATEARYVADAYDLLGPFSQLVRELTTILPQHELGVTMAVDRLLLEVHRLLQPSGREVLLRMHAAVRRACDLLESHCELPWTLARLAAEVGLAPNYLAQRFSAEVGRPPHRYLLEQRLRRAKDLLAHSDLPIGMLALELGFSNGQHFARTFRAHEKVSPRAYRDAARDTANT